MSKNNLYWNHNFHKEDPYIHSNICLKLDIGKVFKYNCKNHMNRYQISNNQVYLL